MRMETYIRKSHGMTAHKVNEVKQTDQGLEATVERYQGRHLRCGGCGLEVKVTRGRVPQVRRWKDLYMRETPLWIVYQPYRVQCSVCGIRIEKVPWAPRYSRVTTALAKAVGVLAKKLSWQDVAEHFNLNWKTVAQIIRWIVSYGITHRKRKPLHLLGIDEVSRKKGHSYFTVIYDLERTELIWVSEGRKEQALDVFFVWLGKRRCKTITAVSMDMWAPYVASVQSNAAQAAIVFDRFHLVRHLNEAVDEVRKRMMRKIYAKEGTISVKGSRYIWLKNPWNLTDKEHETLRSVMKMNLPIVRAYLLKEAFQRLWNYRSEGWARRMLKQWFWWATHSRLKPLRDFAYLLRRHEEGILAWTRLRISNGTVEGMNNKIKLISRRAYGFRDPYNYIAAIFHSCANLPTPT